MDIDNNVSLTTSAFSRLQNVKIYIETYGCTYNFGDTQKIIDIAKFQGCTVVDSDVYADIIIINTCIVISKTEDRMYERIIRFSTKPMIVTGCLPGLSIQKVFSVNPNAYIIDPSLIHSYYQHIKPNCSLNQRQAVVQISCGCNGHCTYCITRLTRGKLVSIPIDEIVCYTRTLINSGAVEIQLTAQDVSSWGLDRDDGLRLPDLLNRLAEIPGEFRIRIGMSNPDTLYPILDEFLDAIQNPKFFLFLHIPVQSGSNNVLKSMGRRYTTQIYEDICARARDKYPDIRISTDYIVGFCGETDNDNEASISQILSTRPSKVNITRYSMRPGTPASKLKNIPEPVKKERSRKLTDVCNQIYDENNNEWIGKSVDVIVTEIVKKGSVVARDRTYQNIVINSDIPIGKKLKVTITGHHRHYLLGQVILEY
ncbi:MAG TPA: tRNA (N(6)-L-threonylcarbamoyladenosine(37)-C(2))-methylthiotransferase [Methanocorpusculum sp.]|nr:tRNA (N(6)-L-threonylcarbamoyladenosine(37)-C(2))-methylthiotransferase [Methanocorpusculum sp.]